VALITKKAVELTLCAFFSPPHFYGRKKTSYTTGTLNTLPPKIIWYIIIRNLKNSILLKEDGW